MAVGTRCADHVTPIYPQKLALTSPTGGGRSVGIVRVRTKATEFSFLACYGAESYLRSYSWSAALYSLTFMKERSLFPCPQEVETYHGSRLGPHECNSYSSMVFLKVALSNNAVVDT